MVCLCKPDFIVFFVLFEENPVQGPHLVPTQSTLGFFLSFAKTTSPETSVVPDRAIVLIPKHAASVDLVGHGLLTY